MIYYINQSLGGKIMSKKKRTIARQKKQNSDAAKQKRAKKAYYASPVAKEKWKEKQARKWQSRDDMVD